MRPIETPMGSPFGAHLNVTLLEDNMQPALYYWFLTAFTEHIDERWHCVHGLQALHKY